MKSAFRLVTLLLTVLALTFSALSVTPAHAATLTVTNTNDSGAGSLRATVAAAAPGDTIVFASGLSGETITLGSTLTIDKNLIIDGSSLASAVTISGNHAVQVFSIASGTTVALKSLTIANGSTSSYGGGIKNSGTLIVTASTFSGDYAAMQGGGIHNSGTLTVTNSTFSGNNANISGGAIYNNGTLTVTNSTFSGNDTNPGGGAIHNNGTLTSMTNTILANTTGGGQDYNGTCPTTSANNLVENSGASCSFSTGDPLLGALGDNGGPTKTFALLPLSPAIDAGDSGACPATDQRGVARPQGAACDIGAVETTNSIQVTNLNDSGPGSLREAIAAINVGGTITFDASLSGGTITLTSTLTINKNLTIDGASLASAVTVSGNNNVRVFSIAAGATVTLNRLTIANGNHPSTGGGIHNSGTLTVTNSTFSSNGADFDGGGIFNVGTLTVTASTFSGNNANNDGGGISNWGRLTVTDSTFSGNNANSDGGGIHHNVGTLTVTNSTFSGNNATNGGGGIFNEGTLTMTNTIVANTPYGNVDYSGDCPATSANNLVESGGASCGFLTGDPLLGALGNYGGSTLTFPLLPGSPAIDAGASCAATDQRGVTRPQGSACDIGAFESQGFTLAKTGGDNQSAVPTTNFTNALEVTVSSSHGEPVNGGKVTFTPPASGASAVLATSPATIGSDGKASVSATANDTAGSYSVTASASGAASVAFSLTNFLPSQTVVYSANGATSGAAPANQQFTISTGGAHVILATNTGSLAKTGYNLTGWNTAADGNGTHYDLGGIYTTPASVILYAEWTSITCVTNLNDSGGGSLRQVIAEVSQGDTIYFDSDLSGGTITLNSTLTIDKNLTIDGASLASAVTVSGNGAVQVFYIASGATVTLNRLTIAHGYNASGGGIANHGNLTVTNSAFSSNGFPADGGGIVGPPAGGGIVNNGTLTVTTSAFSGNSTTNGGGGISNSGMLTVANSAFSGNQSDAGGGGISNSGTLTVANSTFSGNQSGAGGGGISNSDTLTVANSTFSGNSVFSIAMIPSGGGIYNNGGTLAVTNSTFSGNSATNGNAGSPAYGGGIYTASSNPTIRNTIFWGNTAEIGAQIYPASGTPDIHDSLIQGGCPAGSTWTNIITAEPQFVDAAHGDVRLNYGSPAIDAGDNANCPANDLDGLPRPNDGDGDGAATCDMGAYEAGEMVCGVSAGSSYAFAHQSAVAVQVTTLGSNLDCLYVDEMERHHPNATGTSGGSGLMTGRYWQIHALQSDKTTSATGFATTLTLPHDDLYDPQVCEYTGGAGNGWDCAATSANSSTVWRANVGAFSDWAVSRHVGPTAVTLQSFSDENAGANLLFAVTGFAALALALAGLVFRPRRTR